MTNTFRALCAELFTALEAHSTTWNDEVLLDRVGSALRRTQPEPEELTDEELLAIAAASIDGYQDSGIAVGEYETQASGGIYSYGSDLIAFARAAIAADRAFCARLSIEPDGPTDEELQRRFLIWWNEEASAMRPHPEHDHEEHARRISEIAWANGAYVARWGRSKPLSLKEQSIALLDLIQGNQKLWQLEDLDVIRRALESIPDPAQPEPEGPPATMKASHPCCHVRP